MITANYICRTEEDFKDLMQYLEDNGVLWNSNTKPTGWGVFDKDRVYCIEDNVMTYNDSYPKVPNVQEWVRGRSKQDLDENSRKEYKTTDLKDKKIVYTFDTKEDYIDLMRYLEDNGVESGGNKMTKKELLEQLEELRNQIDTLNAKIKELDENTEPNTRTKPMEGRPFNYIYTNREIEIHQEDFFDKVFDVSPTKTRVSIGNYFKNKSDARKVIRAMEIEQAVRVRRIELNNGWEPDWDNRDEDKFYIYSEPRHNPNSLRTGSVYFSDYNPIFGYYKSLEFTEQIQEEFREELLWYFNEYYPNRDKMYIWNKEEQ